MNTDSLHILLDKLSKYRRLAGSINHPGTIQLLNEMADEAEAEIAHLEKRRKERAS